MNRNILTVFSIIALAFSLSQSGFAEPEVCVKRIASTGRYSSDVAAKTPDFGPSRSDVDLSDYFRVTIKVSNESEDARLYFAHDMLSKVNIDYAVFEFAPGCSQEVPFMNRKTTSRSFDIKVGPKDKGFYDLERDCERWGCSFWKGMDSGGSIYFASTEENPKRGEIKTYDLPTGKYCAAITHKKIAQDDHRLDIVLRKCESSTSDDL